MQKYVFLKLDLKVKRQYFRYKEYINWLQIDEILTYVFMYGGPSTLFLRYEPLKNDVTIFDPFSGLKTRFRHFPTPGGYLFVKMKNSRGGSHIWNGYGCKARAPTGWGIRWEHRLKKWGVIGWEHDFWQPVREKSKNMKSYWSKNEGSLGESTIFFIRWVKFGIRWEKNIKIYGVFGWEHMRL